MADNYLEKKMEDYRRGVNSVSPRRSHNVASKGRELFPEQLRIALILSDMELLGDILAEFRYHANLKTAFAGIDQKSGSRLAQSTGSLFIPCKNVVDENSRLVEVMNQRWGGVDVIVTDNSAVTDFNPEIRVIKLCNIEQEHQTADRTNLTTVYFGDNNPDFTKLAQLLPLLIAAPASIISTVTVK